MTKPYPWSTSARPVASLPVHRKYKGNVRNTTPPTWVMLVPNRKHKIVLEVFGSDSCHVVPKTQMVHGKGLT